MYLCNYLIQMQIKNFNIHTHIGRQKKVLPTKVEWKKTTAKHSNIGGA